MKQTFNPLFAVAMTLVITSCCNFSEIISAARERKVTPSGKDTTIVYNIPNDYTAIDASCAMDVEYTTEATAVTVTTDAAYAKYLNIYLEGTELNLGLHPVSINGIDKIKVLVPVSARGLGEVELSGASSFYSAVILQGNELDIDCSGATKFDAEVDVRDLDVDCSGASKVLVCGKADDMSIDCSGASKVSDDDNFVTARHAEIDLSGASKAYIEAAELDGDISGASIIRYRCENRVRISTSGASKAEKF